MLPRRDREYFVKPLQHALVQYNLKAAQCAFELLQRARTDNRCGDSRISQQPGKRDIVLRLPQLAAKLRKSLQLALVLFNAFCIAAAAAALNLHERIAAEQPSVERTPWNNAKAETLRCRQHLKLRQPAGQAVFMLLGDQTEKTPGLRF